MMSTAEVPTGRPRRGWVRRLVRLVLAVVVAVVVISAGYVAVVAIRSGRPLVMPALSGPYRVGRTAFEWTDHARTDPLAPHPGAPRELSVWLWYPASPTASGRAAQYAPGVWGGLQFKGPPGWFESKFKAIKVQALDGVPVAMGRFPVVVVEPGMGLSAPQYTALAENLASHGYLVAGVTPTYSANLTVLHGKAVVSAKAGNPADLGGHSGHILEVGDRLVDIWAADARFVATQVVALDQVGRFAGRISKTPISYVGHSFGGAASLQACQLDRNCAGAVDLDGTQFGKVVKAGLRAPLMIVGSEDSCVTGVCGPSATDSGGDRDAARSLLAASTGHSWLYTIDGVRHFNFTDYSVYFLAPPIRNFVALGNIDGRRALAIQADYVVAFLDHVVRGTPEPLLNGPSQQYPEVKAG
jgi:dienelactone hydrolase